MTAINYNLLREVAEKATPGPWTAYESLVIVPDAPAEVAWDVCDCALGSEPEDKIEWAAALADARHIAAWSPQTALKVLDAIAAAQAELASIHSAWTESLNQHRAAHLAQLAAMTAARDEACRLLEKHAPEGSHGRQAASELRTIGAKP